MYLNTIRVLGKFVGRILGSEGRSDGARRAQGRRLHLERLESRDLMATLDITGGALTFIDSANENNNLIVAVQSNVYSFHDSATPITLGSGAVAAGWRGSGTNNVSGPASSVSSIDIDVAGGTNVVNLRSLNNPTTINGGSGTTAVNMSSNAPINSGRLNLITADVTVNAGDSTSLNVADVTAASGHSNVVIDANSITGLAPATISYTGTLTSLYVKGSASTTLAESFTVNSPPATYFRLDTNAGPDTVTISGNTTGDIYLGSAFDTLTVMEGITLTGDVHAKNGDTINYGEPTYGTITGTIYWS